MLAAYGWLTFPYLPGRRTRGEGAPARRGAREPSTTCPAPAPTPTEGGDPSGRR